MLDNLRKKQKGIIWLIAIVFVGGMAVMGIVDVFHPRPYVGKIYGKKIYRDYYEQLYREEIQRFRMENPNATLDEQTLQSINDQTWNRLVARTIFDRQLKKNRIKVRDADVRDKFRNDPPAELRQNPSFQTNGVFDMQKYFEIVAQNPAFAYELEQYIRMTLPYEKLERKIKDQVVVTTDSVRVDWLSKNDRSSGRVISFDWNAIEEQEVSDAEIEAYYKRNSSKYRKDATRRYRFVMMPFVPSAEDTLRARDEIYDLYAQVRRGGDFAELAEMYSADPGSAAEGGSLGFFGRGRMVPAFEEVAFNLEIGEISEPFLSPFGYHFMTVTDKRTTEEGNEEVEASHILIRIETSDFTAAAIERNAHDLFERAERVGLEQAATEMGFDIQETGEFTAEAEFISGMGRYPHLVKEAFSSRLGKVMEPVRATNGAYYVAELSHREPTHIQSLEQVSEVVKREVDREKRLALARKQADELFASFPADEWLAQADSLGYRVSDFNNILITQSIRGIGFVRPLNRAIFDTAEGEWTEIVTTDGGIYRAFVSRRNTPSIEIFERDIERLTETYRTERENTHYNEWYQRVLREAKVEDLRTRHRF